MSAGTDQTEYTFQAEIKQLLHLLSHSLYQNREIAIRELISNASDALDKFRHISLTHAEHRDESELEIHVDPDPEQKQLVIRDNGIGMTRDELVDNLGTIAHSGSLDFLKSVSDSKQDLSLIGQFGVGFYSAFMLADRVEVITKSYADESGYRWESDGTGTFSIVPESGLERGTRIVLHLKDDLVEFTRSERLKYILNKYSTFVPHPIKLDQEHINNQPPIWVEPKSQLSGDQYESFYQYLSHRTEEKPLWHLHLSSDSPFQFHSILYCPAANLELLGFARAEHGLHLCAKRILVQNDCRDLLPEYLRFVYGIVDSADLPLNVSRESLQDNTVFRKIRSVLVKRVLSHLEKIASDSPQDYQKFHEQFGSCVREGVQEDFENRERIAGLLRFQSSHNEQPGAVTSLDGYLERCKEDQKQIYYLGGPDLAVIRQNPNLETTRKAGIEVLYLTDPIDEFVLTALQTFKDHQIVAIDSADADFPESDSGSETEEAKPDQPEQDPEGAAFQRVLKLFRESLGDAVSEVRPSKRLTDSPCCLVSPQGAASAQLQKILSQTHQGYEIPKRIMEVNPNSPFIARLCAISSNDQNNDFIKKCGSQLYSNAMLLEGLAPAVPDLVQRMQQFMVELADKRSTIIT